MHRLKPFSGAASILMKPRPSAALATPVDGVGMYGAARIPATTRLRVKMLSTPPPTPDQHCRCTGVLRDEAHGRHLSHTSSGPFHPNGPAYWPNSPDRTNYSPMYPLLR